MVCWFHADIKRHTPTFAMINQENIINQEIINKT
jgi:hypothetical protein